MKTIKPEEIHWTTAEILEPLDSLSPPRPLLVDEGKSSPKGAWTAQMRYKDGDEPRWYPRDFQFDPHGTLMLLEWLWGQPEWECIIGNAYSGASNVEIEMTPNAEGYRQGYRGFALTRPLREAVVTAFLWAHGVEVEMK
jgi:hypothetical protein